MEIFEIPKICYLSKENIKVPIYSIIHLKLILSKIKYQKPYFINKREEKVFLNDVEINKLDLNKLSYIVINDTFELKEEIKKYYDNNIKIYSEEYIFGKSTYEFISPNFNKYFKIKVDLNKKFFYFNPEERNNLFIDIVDFAVSEKKNQLYPICGPYGIGKSIMSLYLQKYLYNRYQIKSLYINLKYYHTQNLDYKELTDTLFKECFFLVENETELVELYNLIKEENKYIWALLAIIRDYLKKKKKKDVLFIIDQYKMKYDEQLNLSVIIKDIKVLLISSINDKDVKSNLIYFFKKNFNNTNQFFNEFVENKFYINYKYINKLTEENTDKIFNLMINDKDNLNNKKNKIFIKENFLNLPKYIDLYIYSYKNIIDLYNNEYKKIFINFLIFYEGSSTENIYSIIENKTEIEKSEFIEYLSKIPLKYINFYENKKKGTIYFDFAFPLIKKYLKIILILLKRKHHF